jgi:hypothetical protein
MPQPTGDQWLDFRIVAVGTARAHRYCDDLPPRGRHGHGALFGYPRDVGLGSDGMTLNDS